MKSTARFVLLIALLLSLLTGAYAETQNVTFDDPLSTSGTHSYTLGLAEETPEEKAIGESLLTSSANGGNELPAQFDNASMYPPPGDQGSMRSCASWAAVYALKSYQERAQRQWGYSAKTLFSPLYTYNQLNDGKNQGTTIQKTMAILVEQGACTLEDFPYHVNAYDLPPTEAQRQSAKNYRSMEYFTVKGVNDFKSAIYNYGGLIASIEVYDDFIRMNSSTNTLYDSLSGEFEGMHAICLTGWDDSLQAFRFINSWGPDWGDGGFGWITYDIAASSGYAYAMKMNIEQHDDVYTVVFNGNGGAGSMESVTVNRNARFNVPQNAFTKGNDQFIGWMVYSEKNKEYLHYSEKKGYSYTSEEMSVQAIIKDGSIWTNLSSSGDTLTFRAVWVENSDEYTVSFSGNGGTGSMQPFTAEGGPVKLPGNLFQKEGYTFEGWFAYIRSSDDARNNKYVYQKDNAYTLFVADQNDPGWFPVIFSDNQEVSVSQFAKEGETVAFVAKWKYNAYTVSFSANEGTGSMQPIMNETGILKLPGNEFQKEAHTFDGWFAYIRSSDDARNNKYVYQKDNAYTLFVSNESDPGWSAVVFTDNQEVSVSQFAKEGETVVFVAKWKYNAYTVSFSANGGTGSMQSMMNDTGIFKLPGNQFQKQGNRFNGWFAYIRSSDDARNNRYVYQKDNAYSLFVSNENDPGWSAVILADNQEVSVSQFAKEGETVIFVARWNGPYTIEFDPNTGTGSMQSITAEPGTVKLPSNQFQKEGYTFNGWYAFIRSTDAARHLKVIYKKDNAYTLFTVNENDPDWSLAVFTDNQEVPQFAKAGETIVFKARWKADDSYTVAFNPDGGTGSMESFTAKPGTVKLPGNQFQKEGYTFNGWFAFIKSEDATRDNKVIYKKDNMYTLFTANENDPDWSLAIFTDNQEVPQFAKAGETIVFKARWKTR